MPYRFERSRFVTHALPPGWPEDDALAFHRTLPGYAPTPLVRFPALAAELHLGQVWVKDESKRFGLNAFKVLGASYAIHRFLEKNPTTRTLTFATATDGNHGRAVAFSAKRLGHRAVIFVPGNTVKARIEAIRSEGAEVRVVDGTYDETVRRAAAEAQAHGWQVISDTAYEGYTEIPRWIMEGYTTVFAETMQALGDERPDAVLLQAGVGGLACAAALFFARRGLKPKLICVEPTDADCLLESAASPDGSLRESHGKQNSIMAGLNCGTPSLLAWPVIRNTFDAYLAVDDRDAALAMRRLYSRQGGDPRVVSGESGAAGLAGLFVMCRDEALRAARATLGLGPGSKVLLISTEGDTDPVSFNSIVGGVR